MGNLSSALSKSEIGLLIEAMGDWEAIGNHEFYAMNLAKKHPVPDESDDNYEFVKSIKDHFKKREKEIQDNRTLRQEQAILVKAKLVLIRQDLGVGQLFENSQASAAVAEVDQIAQEQSAAPTSKERQQLQDAEFYIRDLGVWDMYQKFIQERHSKAPEVAPGWHHGEDADQRHVDGDLA